MKKADVTYEGSYNSNRVVSPGPLKAATDCSANFGKWQARIKSTTAWIFLKFRSNPDQFAGDR